MRLSVFAGVYLLKDLSRRDASQWRIRNVLLIKNHLCLLESKFFSDLPLREAGNDRLKKQKFKILVLVWSKKMIQIVFQTLGFISSLIFFWYEWCIKFYFIYFYINKLIRWFFRNSISIFDFINWDDLFYYQYYN